MAIVRIKTNLHIKTNPVLCVKKKELIKSMEIRFICVSIIVK